MMDLLETFKKDWSNDANVVSLCTAVYRFLLTSPKQDHFSFSQLREVSGAQDESKLAQTLLYLSGPRLNVVKFVFFVEVGDEMREVTPDENGELRDEFSGEELDPARLLTGFEVGSCIAGVASSS